MSKIIEFKTLPEYFEFFEKIPEDKWTTAVYERKETGCRCAIGHLTSGGHAYALGKTALDHPFYDALSFDKTVKATEINDGCWYSEVKDLGDTPKERILNAIILKESGILDEV